MSADLSPIIAATTRWLVGAYPAPGAGAFSRALAEVQAKQAVTVAAWLRYPTAVDAGLVVMAGPGGSAHLDRLAGAAEHHPDDAEHAWRTWVDEVVASWATCLLADPQLAAEAVAALAAEHGSPLSHGFRRLLDPGEQDRRAAALLRHPDLVAPVADLHRGHLYARLGVDTQTAA
ncbi:hypothetical protein GCM10011581_21690 [Saccharopolyspora subtropica]|uniref:Uncharacterized protein n=1 Tax=Saccharopolyspora thermophila TaxID=89367 RepID=A0A917JTP1_9PSEU|nr:hypothetical protein [Saccharopolyspora subtropica]GGI84156.1 hypothetical protein GCM10011581_21690 [Saccharopolyspora subtropica]